MASEAEVALRVAMLRHPEVGRDPFELARLSGLAADEVQGLLLSEPDEATIGAYYAAKLQWMIDLTTPDPYWNERFVFEEMLNGDND